MSAIRLLWEVGALMLIYHYGDGQKPATLVTRFLYKLMIYSLTTSGCGMCLPVSLVD